MWRVMISVCRVPLRLIPGVSGNGDDFSIFRRRQISTCYRPAAGENLENCTCFCYKLYVVLVFVLKKSIISLEPTLGSTKIRILRVKIRRLSTLKLKLSFLVSVAPSEPKNFRLVHLTPGINRNGTLLRKTL